MVAVLTLPRASCWWLLWGALTGLFFELVCRLGGTEALGEALLEVAEAIAECDFGGGGE